MALVKIFLKYLPTLFIIAVLCAAQPTTGDVDIKSLNEHVKKMDAALQRVQSHSQAQEEQYRALLSDLLSQIIHTNQELGSSKIITKQLQFEVAKLRETNNNNLLELTELKQSHNETLFELTELKQSHNETLLELTALNQSHNKTLFELTELKESHNKTLLNYTAAMEKLDQSHNDTLQALKESHNQSLMELEKVKNEIISLQHDLGNCNESFFTSESTVHGLSQLNSSQAEALLSLAEIIEQMNVTGYMQLAGHIQPLSYRNIGFEATLAEATTFSPFSRIVFNKVNYNEGNGYDRATGIFTAPVSGTYLFWTHVVYNNKKLLEQNKSIVVFNIETMGKIFSRAYGITGEVFGTASTTTIISLKKGEITWIQPSAEIELNAFDSTVGAVLIR